MKTTLERHWFAHGLECAVLKIGMGHRCGYVCVPADHPWYGVAYNEPGPAKFVDNRDFTVDDVGVIPAFLYAMAGEDGERDRCPEYQIRVHGGLTFSGSLSHGGLEGHWFGFDCAHAGDWSAVWTEERVAEETERLAEQLANVALQVPKS